MRLRNVDSNWDWQFGHGQCDYARDAHAVALDIKMKLYEWKRDCFFDLQSGVAWRTRLGSKGQKALLDKEIQEIARGVDGVLNIFEFDSAVDVNTRHYRCSFLVYQKYSTELLPVSFET